MIALDLISPTFDWYNSYGRLAGELLLHLTDLGVRVNAVSPHVHFESQPRRLRALLRRPRVRAKGSIALGYPTLYEAFGGKRRRGARVAVTMFESTQLPDGWADKLNTCQAVIVPSRFLVDIFRSNGVTAPIEVVPLGISEAFQPVARPAHPRPFRFLAMGDNRRKGWDVAFRAFHMAFGRDPAYELVIKVRRKGFRFEVRAENVRTIAEDMTNEELATLFGSVDAFVFPTRGEGFGLPPREAAATGLPVITTAWGGTADDLVAWGYPIRYRLVDAWPDDPKLKGLGLWAEPDVEHLAEQMRYVASGAPGVRAMAEHSARRVRNLYSWRRFAEGVLEAWKRAANHPVTERRRRMKVKAYAG